MDPRTFLIIILVMIGAHLWLNEAKARDFVYIEIGFGNNTNLTGASHRWENADAMGAWFAVGWRTETSSGWYDDLHWTHISQYDAGRPFNDKDESSVDHIGWKFGYMF